MAHVVKISKEGHDVVDGKRSGDGARQRDEMFLAYMVSGIAIPFLYGAARSLQRYISAAEQLTKDPNNTFTCLYESSSLLEHLDAVDRYIIMCGNEHSLHDKILNMRNHIRHDLRDNLSHESNDGRTKRAKKLGISEKLLVDISFDENFIKIGKTILSTVEIIEFIEYAKTLFSKYIEEATAKGLVKGIRIVK